MKRVTGWSVLVSDYRVGPTSRPTDRKGRTRAGVTEMWSVGRSGCRGVEQRHLLGVGFLEECLPLLEVGATDRLVFPRRCRVSFLDAALELIEWSVEVVQFDPDSQASRLSS